MGDSGTGSGILSGAKDGPSKTNLEGGLPENQIEKVLWISGAWGTWQYPHPNTSLLRHPLS